jgi:hypothetical protein
VTRRQLNMALELFNRAVLLGDDAAASVALAVMRRWLRENPDPPKPTSAWDRRRAMREAWEASERRRLAAVLLARRRAAAVSSSPSISPN